MDVPSMKLHLSLPSPKTPKADKPLMIADTIENTVEIIPSKAKIRNSVTSVSKVSNTHFKLHVLEMADTVLRASITQWKGLGNILVLTCEATEACHVSDKSFEKSWFCFEGERKKAHLLLSVRAPH